MKCQFCDKEYCSNATPSMLDESLNILAQVDDIDIYQSIADPIRPVRKTHSFAQLNITGEYDFFNRFYIITILILLFVNIYSNYLYYSRYTYFSNKDNVILNEDQYIQIILVALLLSIMGCYSIFKFNNSYKITRILGYLLLTEIAGVLGTLFNMFWLAAAFWAAFITFAVFNFNINYIRPSREQQLAEVSA